MPVVAAGGVDAGRAAADSAGPAAVAIGVLADGGVRGGGGRRPVARADLRAAAAETASFNPVFHVCG